MWSRGNKEAIVERGGGMFLHGVTVETGTTDGRAQYSKHKSNVTRIEKMYDKPSYLDAFPNLSRIPAGLEGSQTIHEGFRCPAVSLWLRGGSSSFTR